MRTVREAYEETRERIGATLPAWDDLSATDRQVLHSVAMSVACEAVDVFAGELELTVELALKRRGL